MDVVCAWCGVSCGTKADPETDDDHTVSHGICDPCRQKLQAQLPSPLKGFLESLDAPVVVLDAEGTVCAANALAGELLGLDPAAMTGMRGGNLFGCVHAREEHGCGGGSHCSDCSLRQIVTFTAKTGRPDRRQTQTPDRGDGSTRAPLLLSTCMRDGMVLLRIQDLTPALR